MSNKTAKELAREVLCHALGVPSAPPYRPLNKAAQTIADHIAGRPQPAEPGTPEAQLQALQRGEQAASSPAPIRSVPGTEMEQMVERLAEQKLTQWLAQHGYKIEEE